MKAILWDEASQGMNFSFEDPGRAARGVARNMIEAAAEASEELMEKYLNQVPLSEDCPRAAGAHRRRRNPADAVRLGVPQQRGAAHAGCGSELMPSPLDVPPMEGHGEHDEIITRKADDNEKFSALAFKLMTDPFVGQLTFVRVYSGVAKGSSVYNRSRAKGASAA